MTGHEEILLEVGTLPPRCGFCGLRLIYDQDTPYRARNLFRCPALVKQRKRVTA